MSEDKLTHVLVPIVDIEQQINTINENQHPSAGWSFLQGKRFVYKVLLQDFEHINPAAQQSYIKQLEDALNKISLGVHGEPQTEFSKYATELAKQALQSKK